MTETGAILGALAVQLVVALAELVAAHVANSHALTIAATLSAIDGATFVLALLPAWLRVHSSPHARASFGSDRAEVLVAFVSVSILIALCVSMSISAARSLFGQPEPVHGGLVFVTASVALVGNFVMATILSCCGMSGGGTAPAGRPAREPVDEQELREMDVLRHHGPDGHEDSDGGGAADSTDGLALQGPGINMNVAAVKAHLWADLGENITVIAAGIIMVLRPHWLFVDPLFSLFVAAGVMVSNAPLVREAVYILCEWAPPRGGHLGDRGPGGRDARRGGHVGFACVVDQLYPGVCECAHCAGRARRLGRVGRGGPTGAAQGVGRAGYICRRPPARCVPQGAR